MGRRKTATPKPSTPAAPPWDTTRNARLTAQMLEPPKAKRTSNTAASTATPPPKPGEAAGPRATRRNGRDHHGR